MYPFRYKIGETVEVIDGHNKGRRGKIVALELSNKKTVGIIHDNGKSYRECESNLRLTAHRPVTTDLPNGT